MGFEAYKVYSNTERDLTSNEQASADLQMNLFIRWYEADVIKAEIPLMPFTELTKSEYDRILKRLDTILESDQLWNKFVSGSPDLSVTERQKINTVGSEWLGQQNWLQYQSNEPFDAEQQKQVDANSRAWLEANASDSTRRLRSSRFFLRQIKSRKLVTAKKEKQVECASAQ